MWKNSPEIENTLKLERAFLGGAFCITSREEFNRLLNIIKPKDFLDIMNKEIFSAMEKKFENDKKIKKNNNLTIENNKIEDIDKINFDYDFIVDTVLKSNKKIDSHEFRVYLEEIFNNNFASFDLEDKANLISEKSKLRELDNLGKRISKIANDVTLTSDIAIEETYNLVEKLTRRTPPQQIVSIQKLAIEQLQMRDRMMKDCNISNAGYKVGFSVIDEKINGLSQSDLIIIAGRPAMGKTAFALNVMLQFCEKNEDLHTLFFSLEMPPNQLYYRLVAMESEVAISTLKYSSNFSKEIEEKYIDGVNKLARKHIDIADTPTLSVYDLKKIARNKKDKGELDLIIVDYIQLLSSSKEEGKSSQNRQQEISDISRELKLLARELNIPIIALSQLSRSLESRSDKRPLLSDLRESGAIEQDADIVLFLYRDEYYNKNSSDLGIAEVIVSKNRNGSIGTVKMKFDPEFTKFTNYIDFSN